MLWLNDSSQNKVSADQYHVTISQVQSSLRSCVLKMTSDQVVLFPFDRRFKSGYYFGGDGGSMCK